MAYGRDLAYYESLGPDHKVNRSRPELEDDADYWYDGFRALSFSRPATMGGTLPIPLVEIEAYCRLCCMPEPDRWEFARMIRRIDLAFLGALEQRTSVTLPPLAQPKG